MPTTKPDTDTGWSKEFPTADGYYWMRFAPDDRCPMPVRYDNGYMHEIGVADDMRWVRDTEKAEFLPASPSDFEQLIRLRKAAGVSQKLIDAVFYALREGCFFPVPEPQQGATVQDLVQWGAMRHLHDAIAEYSREKDREALALTGEQP